MTAFDQLFTTFGIGVLLEQHGEQVQLTPKGGSPVSIQAIVERKPLQTKGPTGAQRMEYEVLVQIPQANYPGGRPNVGGDRIVLRTKKGDRTPVERVIAAIVSEEGGMWTLGLN